jgi:carbon monoxide dehydrogenase subunit G
VELNNDFEVSAPLDTTWAVLTDVERIAPCLPGAQLQEVEGDEYRGIVKVKVGPITAQYKGAASFVERDDTNHRAVLKADGRDTRGAGNASALITATAEPSGAGTKVTVSTDLTVTGKVAQFGRGVMADVSAKLMGQFADNLEKLLEGENSPAAGDGGAEPTSAPAASSGASTSSTNGGATAATADSAGVSVPSASAGAATGAAAATGTSAGGPTAAAPTSATGTGGVRRIDSPEPQAVDLLDTAGAPVLKRLAPVLVAVVVLFLLRRKFRKRA